MKTHLSKKQILLYLLNELSQEKRKSIEDHLKSCSLCQKRYAQEEHIKRMITAFSRLEPSSRLLEKSRLLLKSKLLKKKTSRFKKSFWSNIWKFLFYFVPTRRYATAFAILLFGIVIGRLLPRFSGDRGLTSQDAVLALQSSLEVTDFKVIPSVDRSDQVDIRFNTVQRQSLKGSLRDPGIQYVLSYVLENESGDDVRLRTIQLLKEYSGSQVVQGALIRTLERDSNPGVRLKAIRLLKTLPLNENIKNILIYALFRDSNSGVRVEAADALNQISDDEVRSLLSKKAKEDNYTKVLIDRNS